MLRISWRKNVTTNRRNKYKMIHYMKHGIVLNALNFFPKKRFICDCRSVCWRNNRWKTLSGNWSRRKVVLRLKAIKVFKCLSLLLLNTRTSKRSRPFFFNDNRCILIKLIFIIEDICFFSPLVFQFFLCSIEGSINVTMTRQEPTTKR